MASRLALGFLLVLPLVFTGSAGAERSAMGDSEAEILQSIVGGSDKKCDGPVLTCTEAAGGTACDHTWQECGGCSPKACVTESCGGAAVRKCGTSGGLCHGGGNQDCGTAGSGSCAVSSQATANPCPEEPQLVWYNCQSLPPCTANGGTTDCSAIFGCW